jgi:SecD/SecF fusion protein
VVIEMLAGTKAFQNEKLLGLTAREPRWKFDFVGKWRLWLAISFIPIAFGAIFIGIKGLNLGLDFNSGTRIEVAFVKGNPTEGQVRQVLSADGYAAAKVQVTTDTATGHQGFQIETPTLQPNQLNQLKRDLDQKLGGIDERTYVVETVGPTFGREVVKRAAWAIALSFLLIIVYLTIRFEYRLALPALLSVVHDVWLSLAIYSITGREVTSATVAALLTILGYSLYDVVVVFDRIRENAPLMRNARYKDVVNRSVHETLTRSVITGLTAIVPVLLLFIFGGSTLRDFAFALLIGLLSGGISSVLIAAPLAAIWKEHQPEGRKRAAKAHKRSQRETKRYEVDGVDMDVLERAEAALQADSAVPSLMRNDEPPADAPQAPTDEPPTPPAPTTPAAPSDAPAGDASSSSDKSAPAPPPERERRHGQVRRRRRS